MGTVRQSTAVPLEPAAAERLWTDTNRWPTFVDGFARMVRQDPEWPAEGSKVVWESGPAGRGTVTEKILGRSAGTLELAVYEERMTGTQTVVFEPGEGGSHVTVELDYQLPDGGPFKKLTDVIFIRRALSDALARTLRRFATEAAEEASL